VSGPSHDLVVIGSGPAGLGAAIETAKAGLRTLVIDEYPTPGGRLLGQLHEEPGQRPAHWWRGAEVAAELVAEAERAGAELRCGTDVWGIFPASGGEGWHVCLARGAVETVHARRILIAAGAGERGLPLPGWELPGVMTVGGAQVMVNVHRVRPGRRALVVGLDPLALTIARELALAGTEVVAVMQAAPLPAVDRRPSPHADAAALLGLSHLAPEAWIRAIGPLLTREPFPALAARLYPKRGIPVWGIPVQLRRACLAIGGRDEVEGVVVGDLHADGSVVAGSEREIAVDLVAVSGGLYPMIELAASLGCRTTYLPELGGHVPLHGRDFATTVEGVFVAGSITGVEGATIAAAQGHAAGIAIVNQSHGRPHADELAVALAEVEVARRETPFRFLPNIAAGRARMQQAWEAQHAAGR
jgi:sarcosine oxidase, subunit alpha